MNYMIILDFIIVITCCYGQFIHDDVSLAELGSVDSLIHPAVAKNAEVESHLPPELLKSSRFLSDPHTAATLAKDSWLTSKEMTVIDREADKIPRDMVYKVFKNAGWL